MKYMKVVVYLPDGTTQTYTKGSGGIVDMFLKAEDRVLHVKYSSSDLDKVVSGFPMIITSS